MPRPRRAFTTIELLVTIGIIIVLVGIVMFGMKSITNTGRTRSTHVALENARALIAERDAVSGLGGGPTTWTRGGNFIHPLGNLNYWKIPEEDTAVPPHAMPVLPPTDVKNDLTQRDESDAVINTTLMMSLLAAVPANRAALNKIPREQVFTPQPKAAIAYPIGTRAQKDSVFYVATADTNTPPGGANWIVDSTPVPILRDGWGNPIIFVPASGLRVVLETTKPNSWIVISPEGQVQGNGTANPVVIKIGRPFFASAGPDGDFYKGDDNIYSFEK